MPNHWNHARQQVMLHTEHKQPLDNVRKYFLEEGRLSELEWESLMSNPENPPEVPPRLGIRLPEKGSGRKPSILTRKREAKIVHNLTVLDLPCVHRGELIEVRECKPCDGGDREVFQCSAVPGGECTLNSSKLRNSAGKIPGCAICELRKPPDD